MGSGDDVCLHVRCARDGTWLVTIHVLGVFGTSFSVPYADFIYRTVPYGLQVLALSTDYSLEALLLLFVYAKMFLPMLLFPINQHDGACRKTVSEGLHDRRPPYGPCSTKQHMWDAR